MLGFDLARTLFGEDGLIFDDGLIDHFFRQVGPENIQGFVLLHHFELLMVKDGPQNLGARITLQSNKTEQVTGEQVIR
jgi:hypothetical protein